MDNMDLGSYHFLFFLFPVRVCHVEAKLTRCVLVAAADDRVETGHYILRLAGLLRFPRDVLLCQRRGFPS